MTLRFSKKEILILVVSLILTITLIFSGYFFYLSPKKVDLGTKTANLKSEQDILTALQKKQTETSTVTVESVAALQRKVPVKAQLEQLILELEKAEVVSGSDIKNMGFSEADLTSPTQQNTTEQQTTDTTNKDANTESTTESTDTSNTSGSETQVTPLPTGIKKLTVTLQVESPSYEELKKFIDTLENSTRIIVIESVGFTGVGEITNLDKEEDKLAFTLTLSAFYMPTLTDLQDQLPELAAPQPSNKTNPFNSFPDLPDEDQTE